MSRTVMLCDVTFDTPYFEFISYSWFKGGRQGEIEELKKKGDILFYISPVNLQVHRLCDNFDYYISLKLSLNLYTYHT